MFRQKDRDVRDDDWNDDDYDEYEELGLFESKKKDRPASVKKLNQEGVDPKGHKKKHKNDAQNRYKRKHRDDFKW